MNKNTKGVIVVVGILAVAFAVWHMTNKSKKQYAKLIVKYGGATGYAALLTFEEGFLKAWSKALVKGSKDLCIMAQHITLRVAK